MLFLFGRKRQFTSDQILLFLFLSPNNMPLTSERLSSLKNKLPSIEATILP